jgi:hypothetical protein
MLLKKGGDQIKKNNAEFKRKRKENKINGKKEKYILYIVYNI